MEPGWYGWLERSVGASFVLAGVNKFANIGEDAPGVLAHMADANAGTGLASLSDWLNAYHQPVIYFVGVAMIAAGLAQLFRVGMLAQLAAIGELAMIVCFVTLLHRGFPIIFLDGFYVMALVPILMHRSETAQA